MATDVSSVEIEYPERDGQPMGESDLHRLWMRYVLSLLEYRFRDERAYVTSDLLLYYVEGDPRCFIVPDVFLVKEHPPGLRRIYKLWQEGKSPNVAFEITSHSTYRDDIAKFAKYQQIGVCELFLFDPTADYLTPALQGFRLGDDDYEMIVRDRVGRIYSKELDANLCLEEGDLVLYDAQTGDRWLTFEEAAKAQRESAEAQRESAEAQRDAERKRALQLEEEIRQLREQLRQQLD